MISFIVIGRNEGWKLKRCFESIFKTIQMNKLESYEAIYVDSLSMDDSIEKVKQFKTVKIFKLTRDFNAAIARNVGAAESKGDVLFFIDGDMEIQPGFLPLVYDQFNGLKHPFVSGQWIDYHYDTDGNLLSKEEYRKERYSDKFVPTTGGLFIISRKLWVDGGGMKNKMRRSQDLDLALRLAKRGDFLLRKKELLAVHHTVPYNDKVRIWRMLFNGAMFYRIVLLRENLFNEFAWKLFIRGNYTFFILLICGFFGLLLSNPLYFLFYVGAVLLRTFYRKERTLRLLLSNLANIALYELSFIFAFMFFWPKENKNVVYEIIN